MGTRTAGSPAHFIPVIALGMGLSLFLPGFTLLTWTSFCLGLFESLAWGWYVALVFGPIYNFFAAR